MISSILGKLGIKKNGIKKLKINGLEYSFFRNIYVDDPRELIDSLRRFWQKGLDDTYYLLDPIPDKLIKHWFGHPISRAKYEVQFWFKGKNLTLKFSMGLLDGIKSEIHEFFLDGELILTVQLLKDYGEYFRDALDILEQILPHGQDFQVLSHFIIRQEEGKGILLSKFGHTQRWLIADLNQVEFLLKDEL
jgi:hypothetical protein